ncbi:hypothetical protein NT2_05_02150 [Caenibius tardaugens NBRC 16725]|uniref:Uncharacterized protein n=1 Tax=Caenibius tardaugens NBRC 16725 TaxID=1219035 RepID=U2YL28_9SPHN|nr:hypothetical protein [Caenibius tardaugens]AZI36640.1 hypothetical protein EGO55_12320 [Caenibius tardaugens NBRC 16725]GAD49295.1 hypothetical protein NT2_05_02150 [Caenibius tardaugens NBRC 16725]
MFGKIIGAAVGERAAKHISGVNGPVGAVLGAGAATVIRRFGPLGILAVAVGGYALKRYRDNHKNDQTAAGASAPATESTTESTTK